MQKLEISNIENNNKTVLTPEISMQQIQIPTEFSVINCKIQYPSERYMKTTSYYAICIENCAYLLKYMI